MSKNKNNDFGFGDFMVPLMDLLSIIFEKLFNLFQKAVLWLAGKGLEKTKRTETAKWFFTKVLKKRPFTRLTRLERHQLKNRTTVLDNDALGYSINGRRIISYKELDKRKHTVVVGASGSGKTALLDTLMLGDLQEGKPVIFIDPKGDRGTLEQFINLCRHYSRSYEVFSETYIGKNRLYLNPAKAGSVTQIADRIFKSFSWSEEYYASKCRQALKEAIKSLKSNSEDINLKSIFEKLTEISDSKEGYTSIKREEIEGLLSKLDNIVDSDFEELLCSKDGKSFHELRNEQKCLYIGLPKMGYAETASAIGKLFMGDINYSVFKTYQQNSSSLSEKLGPLAIYVDELSAIITDEYIELLNKCRGAKVEITSAFQSTSDIEKVNPHLCQQIMENSANWFVMNQSMSDAAEMLSASIGTLASSKQTVRVENGQKQDLGSQRDVEERIAHPNIIKELSTGQAVFFRKAPKQVDLLNVKYIAPEILKQNLKFMECYGDIRELARDEDLFIEFNKNQEKASQEEDGGMV